MSKETNKVYNTARWKKLRLQVLQEEGYRCHWCGGKATQADHLVELDRGGDPYERTNLVASCRPCNAKRGSHYQAKKNQKAVSVFGERRLATPPPNFRLSGSFSQNENGSSRLEADGWSPGQIPPRLVTPTLGSETFGGEVAAWAADNLGVELYPWQRLVLDGMLEHENDTLHHRWALVSTARQNGKSRGLLAPLIGWWLTAGRLVRNGPQNVISVAHKLNIAEDIAKQLFPVLEDRYGFETYTSFGRMEAIHEDGSRWKIEAGNARAGHGTSNDLVICDEIWKLDADVIEAGLLPTQRAKRNPFALFVSTAGTEASRFFIRWRERGMQQIEKGEPGRLYMAEWSPPPNVAATDRDYWHMGNPAIGLGELTMQDLEDELQAPDRDNFMRSSLNLWTSAIGSWIPPQIWPALETTDPMPAGGVLAVDSDLDDMRYCGVRVAQRDDGDLQVHADFVVESISELWEQVEQVMEDPTVKLLLTPGIAALCPLHLQRRMDIFGQQEITRYTAIVRGLILEQRIHHSGQMALTEQVQRAVAGRHNATITLASQKSPGPIEQCRCMVAAAGLAARPAARVQKPQLGIAT